MSKRKAIRIDHIADVPTDLEGVFLRIEHRYWADGTSCLHIAKWGRQPNTGKPAPWFPLQYIQMPWEMAENFAQSILKGLG